MASNNNHFIFVYELVVDWAVLQSADQLVGPRWSRITSLTCLVVDKSVVQLRHLLSVPRGLLFPSKLVWASAHGGLRTNHIGQSKLHGQAWVCMGRDYVRKAIAERYYCSVIKFSRSFVTFLFYIILLNISTKGYESCQPVKPTLLGLTREYISVRTDPALVQS